MKYLKVTLISILTVILGLGLLSVIAFVVAKTFYLTPEKLTNLIKQEVNEQTNILFDCQSIELSYWDTWPTISIAVKEGKIKLPARTPHDSIKYVLSGTFKKATGSIQFTQFLTNRELSINNIQIYQPHIHCIGGKKMLPIVKKKPNKGKQKVHLQVNKIKVYEGSLSYLTKKGTTWKVSQAYAEAKGELGMPDKEFDLTVQIPQIYSDNKAFIPNKNISLTLTSHCNAVNKFKSITLNDARLMVNDFPFSLNGTIHQTEKGKAPDVDLRFKLLAADLKDLIEFIPEKSISQCKDYKINGKVALEGSIEGATRGDTLPDIQISGFIQNGSLIRKDMPYGIDKLSLNLNFNHLQDKPDSSFLAIDNLNAEGLGSKINMRCMISNLLTNPYIAADILGNLDFNRFSKEFLPENTTQMEGKVKMDMACAFLWDDVLKQKFQQIKIQGDFQADNISAINEKEKLNLYTKNVNIHIGNQKNKSDFIKENEILNGIIDIDTLHVVYKQATNLNLSQLHIRTNTTLTPNKEAIQPITAHAECSNLRAQTNQKQWIAGNNIEIHAGSKASPSNPLKEERALVVKADMLRYVDTGQQHAAILRNSNFIAEFRPSSHQGRTWDIKGIIELKNSQVYTALFPLKINIPKGFLHFQNDQFSLNRFEIQAGKSDCLLSGSLAADSQTKELEGSLQMSAQYIDYDELYQTFLYGKANNQKKETRNIQDLTIDNFEQKIQSIKKETTITDRSIYLPKNLSLNILFDIDESNYKEMSLQQIKGNITLKEQKALADFSTRTNLGKTAIHLLYDSHQKDNIKTVFDINLKDILVAQIHKVIPTIGTMLPLTKSMDGLADCHVTAFTQLDNQMLPVLASTKAICTFKGQKLVVLDNKTFNEIAKRFRFKDRTNKVINQLEANIVMNNGKIEVIPFAVEWDRYKAIIGGTHGIDMNYNYHIDMLKSPIPIDFGINITGNDGDLKFKISKCKYKNLFKNENVQYSKEVNQKIRQTRQSIAELIKL